MIIIITSKLPLQTLLVGKSLVIPLLPHCNLKAVLLIKKREIIQLSNLKENKYCLQNKSLSLQSLQILISSIDYTIVQSGFQDFTCAVFPRGKAKCQM